MELGFFRYGMNLLSQRFSVIAGMPSIALRLNSELIRMFDIRRRYLSLVPMGAPRGPRPT